MHESLKTKLEALCRPALPGIQLGLERMRALLEALGNPQEKFPPVIHVAGTNGKGSLLAFLRAIFEAAGLKVHRYISPELVRFHERILLAGKEIEDAYLSELLDRVLPRLGTHPVTSFEAGTALAFLAFAEKPADILLLETGLGGRLDATNIMEKPHLTAITPVAMDHAEFLGDSIEKIAREKAGILKAGVPCVVGPQQPDALRVIEEAAQSLHAPLFRYGKEWTVTFSGEKPFYDREKYRIPLTPLSLAGEHQYYNAATAVACVESLKGFSISDQQVRAGLAQAQWPARLQPITDRKWLDLLPEGSALWLDGGHNLHAAEALVRWASAKKDKKPLCLILGMQKTKDLKGFLTILAPQASQLVGIASEGMPMYSPEDIASDASCAKIGQVGNARSLPDALRQVLSPSHVLICGSLQLARLLV